MTGLQLFERYWGTLLIAIGAVYVTQFFSDEEWFGLGIGVAVVVLGIIRVVESFR